MGGTGRYSVNVSADPATVPQGGQSPSNKKTFTGGIRGNRKAKDRPERALQDTHTCTPVHAHPRTHDLELWNGLWDYLLELGSEHGGQAEEFAL